MKIITDLGNSAKNNVLIDLVTEEDSDEVKYKRDTGIVYDGGRQLLGSSLEVKTKIAICQKCIRKNIHQKTTYKNKSNKDVRRIHKIQYNIARYHNGKKRVDGPKFQSLWISWILVQLKIE